MNFPVSQRGLLLVTIDRLRSTAERIYKGNRKLPRRQMRDYLLEIRSKMAVDLSAVKPTDPAQEQDAMFLSNLTAFYNSINSEATDVLLYSVMESLWAGWLVESDEAEWRMGRETVGVQ